MHITDEHNSLHCNIVVRTIFCELPFEEYLLLENIFHFTIKSQAKALNSNLANLNFEFSQFNKLHKISHYVTVDYRYHGHWP